MHGPNCDTMANHIGISALNFQYIVNMYRSVCAEVIPQNGLALPYNHQYRLDAPCSLKAYHLWLSWGIQYVVRDGGTVAAMVSMNRLGPRWTGAHEGLVRATLREEWGFQGMVITDQASVESMFYQDMISGLWAGTDLWLNTNTRFWSLKDYQTNATVMSNAQNAAKNIIYAVAKSNAMGATGTVATEGTPFWKIGLYALDVVVFGACAAWVVVATAKLVKRKRT